MVHIVNGEIVKEAAPSMQAASGPVPLNSVFVHNGNEVVQQQVPSASGIPTLNQNPYTSATCDIFGRKISPLYLGIGTFIFMLFFGFKALFIVLIVVSLSMCYKQTNSSNFWLTPSSRTNVNTNAQANKPRGGLSSVRTLNDLPRSGSNG